MIAAILLALILAKPVASQATSASPSLPDCRRLSASLDSKDGEFDGMSHSGGLLTLRNVGLAACRTPGLPTLTFFTRAGKRLDIARRAPPGMHPGPVVVPVTLWPGETATAALRWVSGEVFDKSVCLSPAKIVVRAGAERLTLPFGRRLCGEAGAPIPFDQPVFQAGAGSVP